MDDRTVDVAAAWGTRRWKRLALAGWGLLLLVLACGGIKERLERLDAETVQVGAGKSTTTIRGGEIVLVDEQGRRAVLTATGLRLLDGEGRAIAAPAPP